jgi:hypothetical protein
MSTAPWYVCKYIKATVLCHHTTVWLLLHDTLLHDPMPRATNITADLAADLPQTWSSDTRDAHCILDALRDKQIGVSR